MAIFFLGDTEHQTLQEKQVATLQKRELELLVDYWDTSDLSVFTRLEAAAEKAGAPITLLASRHGAIPATHWTARNPQRVRRLLLLHPSLHLTLPYQQLPAPHFVPTMVVCNSKEFIPSSAQLSVLAGKLFHDYALHITAEPLELTDTLSLIHL